MPRIGILVFTQRLPVQFMASQLALLLAVALQHRSLECIFCSLVFCLLIQAIASELSLDINQVMALFNKCIRKISEHLRNLVEQQVAEELNLPDASVAQKAAEQLQPLPESLTSEFGDGSDKPTSSGNTVIAENMAKSLRLKQFKIDPTANFEEVLAGSKGIPTIVSVAAKKRKRAEAKANEKAVQEQEAITGKRKQPKSPGYGGHGKPPQKKRRKD